MREPIHPGLLQAFYETEYRVHTDPAVVLRIGEPSPTLRALHAAHGVTTSAFVTACNPRSQQLSEAANRARMDDIRARLRAAGFAFLAGIGQHPSNGWPGEESVFILGMGREAALQLGEELQQHAVVFAACEGQPELLVMQGQELPQLAPDQSAGTVQQLQLEPDSLPSAQTVQTSVVDDTGRQGSGRVK
jgi:hypothetical protein